MTPADIEAEFSILTNGIQVEHINIDSLNSRWAHLKGEAANLRKAVKDIEAGIMANTLFDGKNEKVREAQFHIECSLTPAWREADEALTGTLIDIESCERDIELRNRSLRAKELQMQFRIEQMQFLNTPRFYKEI